MTTLNLTGKDATSVAADALVLATVAAPAGGGAASVLGADALPTGVLRAVERLLPALGVKGKADEAGEAGDEAAVAALAQKILDAIAKQPLYYTDIAERFSDYDFNTVARALGHLHKTEKLWQDSRGRMCVRGSKFAAVLPVKK